MKLFNWINDLARRVVPTRAIPRQPERIAILGGGAAALATAYELTLADDWKDRYQVTVYQLGWRLGGKGASGRNADVRQRIEEHGLHVWPGFYDNAFRMIRRCYRELNRPAGVPFRAWDQAFKPQDHLAVEELLNGNSEHWLFTAHRNPGEPGDPRPLPSLWELAARVLETIRSVIKSLDSESPAEKHAYFDPFATVPMPWRALPGFGGLAGGIDALLGRTGELIGGPRHLEPVDALLKHAIGAVQAWLQLHQDHLTGMSTNFRRLWIYVDLATTNLRGMLADGVFRTGLDPLDAVDYRRWLGHHGASATTIDSALVRGLYAFVFADVRGQLDLGAGAAIRLSLRTGFGYQGAIMYKMRAGMGDIVFAPLYEYLQRRGVVFKFFHRVRKLTLSHDKTNIETIELGRQATLTSGTYDPLIAVRNLPCWPNRPRYDQLIEGDELRQQNIDLESCWSDWLDVEKPVLTRGTDFDRVVLGIALGALGDVCTDLTSAFPRWHDLLTNVPTVATGAAQLWWTPALAGLGWSNPSPVLTAFERPFDTWADMSQTIAAEGWDPSNTPKSVAYLCGTLPDPIAIPPCNTSSNFSDAQHGAVRISLEAWLRQKAPHLWPNIVDSASGSIRWHLLHAESGTSGEARLDEQFGRANFEPSGRYVQSPADSLQYRLRPADSGIGNLVLAGDWTRNGINVGCIEAAVISGMRAARVIQGDPTLLPGEADGLIH